MPTATFPNLARIEVRANVLGQGVMNTFYALNTTAWTVPTLTALGTSIVAYCSSSAALANFSTSTVFTEIVLTDMTTVTSPSVIVPFAASVNGTNGGSALPNNVTWALKRDTGLRGRSYRGRVYEYGMTDSMLVSPNVVSPAHATAFQTYVNGLVAVINTAGYTEVVFSFTLGIVTPVTNYVQADNTLDSQRRRLPGRGR